MGRSRNPAPRARATQKAGAGALSQGKKLSLPNRVMPACRLRVKAYSLLVARSIVGTGFTVASVVAPTPFGGDWLVDTATVVCGAVADPSAFAGGLDACLALALADCQAAAELQVDAGLLQGDGLQATNGLEAAAAAATATQG